MAVRLFNNEGLRRVVMVNWTVKEWDKYNNNKLTMCRDWSNWLNLEDYL